MSKWSGHSCLAETEESFFRTRVGRYLTGRLTQRIESLTLVLRTNEPIVIVLGKLHL